MKNCIFKKTIFRRSLNALLTLFTTLLLTACSQSLSFSNIVNGPENRVLTISPIESQLICSESLDLETSGGVPPYELSILTALGGNGESLEDLKYTAPTETTGTVLIQVKDSYGDTKIAEITVISLVLEDSPLNISPSSISIYRTKTVSLEASGGTGEYSYTLYQSIGGTGESLVGNKYTAPANLGGTAIVRVTDAGSNIVDAEIIVANVSAVDADINYNNITVVNSGSNLAGGPLSGTFTFQNFGEEHGSEEISWVVYYSEDLVIGPGDTVVSQGVISGLAGKTTSEDILFSGTWPYPPDDKDYNLIASLNAEDDIDSSDNTGYVTVSIEAVVIADIDYIISESGLTFTIQPNAIGDNFTTGFNLINRGTVDGIEDVEWRAYRSIDENWSEDDLLLAYGSWEAQNSNGDEWKSIVCPSGPAPAGSYYLIVKFMADDEINKTNNSAIKGPFTLSN